MRVLFRSPGVTAEEVSAKAHISGREMAKPVMVVLDEQLVMVVLPASERLHLGRLRQAVGASEARRSEEHTSELQSLMRISYAVFCLKKKKKNVILHRLTTEKSVDNIIQVIHKR